MFDKRAKNACHGGDGENEMFQPKRKKGLGANHDLHH